jgi:predicted hydrocarbon binding protein
MDRREVLKQSCCMGVCSCLGLAQLAQAAPGETPPKPGLQDGQIEFMRMRLQNLLEIVAATLDEPARANVLGKLGRQCGREMAEKFKGNPEGFWTYAKTLWIDRVEYDKEKGIVRVFEKERTRCNCPLAAFMKVPKGLCLCSLGTQQAIYESLFNQPVKVKQEESVLQGAKRCSFTITLEKK